MKAKLNCVCESGKPFAQCCAPLHVGAVAASAEALMRSRYSAYVLQLAEYLLSSWHVSTRPSALAFDAQTRWLGLSIKQCAVTGPTSATVEFVARFREGGGSAQRLHEVSRFVCEDGRWFYVDGDLHSK